MRIAGYIGKYWTGAEVMYGIIITMTFTSILRDIPIAPDVVVDKIILAALACCIAWGIADGLFYLWERQYITRRENRIMDLSHAETTQESALPLVEEELDDTILRTIPAPERQLLYGKLIRFLATVQTRGRILPGEAATIVIGTFMLSGGTSLIVVTPFFLVENIWQALVVSNVIGILLLFFVGYFRANDRSFASRVVLGFGSSFIGIIIAGITVALGG